jgi:hypothetical protein
MLMMQQQVINNVSWQQANFWKLVMKPELGTVIIKSRTRQRGHLLWSFYVIGTDVEFGTSEIGTSYKFSSTLKGFLHEMPDNLEQSFRQISKHRTGHLFQDERNTYSIINVYCGDVPMGCLHSSTLLHL